MKNRQWAAVALLCLLTTAMASPARAHSTKGRVRVPLEKAVLEIDDVAYFFESYVHREFYKDRFEKSRHRFYVKKFLRIDQAGDRATVHFLTLDVKEKNDIPDKMTIYRGEDGGWIYRPPDGNPIPVYTYITRWNHYYRKVVLPVSIAGVLVAGAFLGWLRFGRRRRVARPAGGS